MNELEAFSAEQTGEGASAPQGGMIAQGVERSAVQSKHMVLIDELINWMLNNPGQSIIKAAKSRGGPFDLSPAWLRMAASSDAFKDRLAQKQKDFDVQIMMPGLKERLAAAAEEAVDRLALMTSVHGDIAEVRDATELLLEQNYKLNIPQNNRSDGVTLNIDSATIAIVESRNKILEGKAIRTVDGAATLQLEDKGAAL